jgi:hypothetical protein
MAQNQLTLYFIPSPKGMDWSSPANLALSALKNKITFQPHFMGHVFVEFQCGQERQLTGMIGKKFDYLNQVLVRGSGLGIFFHSFEGTLENKDEVDAELAGYFKNGGLNFTRYLLNDGQCARISEYLKVYREKDVGRYYGLANRPRFGEGAGCSAFGASFPDVLGILDQDARDAWSHSVNIPLEYAGPPLREESVNILKLMMNAGKWAEEKENHKKIFFWDPDRMYKWTEEKMAKKNGDFKVINIENVKGIVFDKSHLPAPGGPIWLQHTEVMTTQK